MLHLFDAVRKIQDTILICPPVVSQHAALGCVVDAGPGYCREHLTSIGAVRAVVLEQLASLGDRIEVAPADGAFYAFLRVRGCGFRVYAHPVVRILGAAEREGLQLEERVRRGLLWESAALAR